MEKVSEEFNREVKTDQNHAQILIKITPSSKTFEEARKIIEELGAHIIGTMSFSSDWVLLKLDVMDMRSIALKLSENGFLKIRGFNAEKLNF